MEKLRIAKTAYPFGYDKNIISNRNTTKFTTNYNNWAKYISRITKGEKYIPKTEQLTMEHLLIDAREEAEIV